MSGIYSPEISEEVARQLEGWHLEGCGKVIESEESPQLFRESKPPLNMFLHMLWQDWSMEKAHVMSSHLSDFFCERQLGSLPYGR
jgi:hypothetical protein